MNKFGEYCFLVLITYLFCEVLTFCVSSVAWLLVGSVPWVFQVLVCGFLLRYIYGAHSHCCPIHKDFFVWTFNDIN